MPASFYRPALLVFCWVSTAQAGVLLEKINYPGFVMPSYAISQNCTIYDNGQLIIHHQVDDISSERTQALHLSKASIKRKISTAATGTISSEIFPVDAATVSYRAYQKQSDGSLKTVLLYEENGGSGGKKVNNSDSAIALRNFIDVNCGSDLLR